jgi:hypothetical protein
MINGFIDRSINLLIRDISDLFSASIQERFELSCDRRTILGRRNLVRRNSNNANFFSGVNRPAQQLLDSGPQGW